MPELTEQIARIVKANAYPIYTLAVLGDRIPLKCVRFAETNRCQDSYSVAKVFAVTAFGLAFDRGLISPEDKIRGVLEKYFPSDADPKWRDATLHHALTHRLGLKEGFLDIDCLDPALFGRDYLKYTFGTPLSFAPGTDYAYTDAAFYIISRAVEEAAGEPIDNLLWREILYPLGFTEFAWSRCPMGHPMGATGVYASDEDVVKIGELYRRGGVWNGQRLLSEKWVNTVLDRRYELAPAGPEGVYGKGGMNGQMLCVFAGKGFSLSWHGYGNWDAGELISAVARTDI